MAQQKITTNHPFSKQQLKSLNAELEKISNAKIVALRGENIPSKQNYTDIKVLSSPYLLDVFLSFMDITDADFPKSYFYKISANGNVDYEARQSLEFGSLAERVTFFNQLEPINFKY